MKILILSPHMDDAVLSCFDHMRKWKNQATVTVVTVFNTYKQQVDSAASKQYLELSGYNNIAKFQKKRIAEDNAALKHLSIASKRLNMTDAAFRTIKGISLYPSYSEIFSNTLHQQDSSLSQLTTLLKKLPTYDRIIVPYGVGNHVDHLITKKAAQRVYGRAPIMYYAEYPYLMHHPLKKYVIQYCKQSSSIPMSILKRRALREYASQINQLFGKRIPSYSEYVIGKL
jgi:LmbE family N-acetylglucosaminyl deacetylase